MNLSDIAILNINGGNYHCIIARISKLEAVKLLKNADLNKNCRTLKDIKHLFSNIKMDEETLAFGDIEIEKNKFYRYKSHF